MVGFCISCGAHVLLAVIVVLVMEHNAAKAMKAPEIFSVTLEGGEKLGGITQVPKPDSKYLKKPLDDAVPFDEPLPPTSKAKEEKKLDEPSAVDDPEKVLAAKKAAEEKQIKELQLKEEQEKKKKAEEAKKKAEEETRAKEEKARKEQEAKARDDEKRAADEKTVRDKERKARDARLAAITNRLKTKYEGESANAGGVGFGAARLGGHGMGGGTLASAEKIAYADALQKHVKAGWHWLPGGRQLRALVLVHIRENGEIDDIHVEESSGNGNFDDSVVRAIRKASPVPQPPAAFYADFAEVRFWFDSLEE